MSAACLIPAAEGAAAPHRAGASFRPIHYLGSKLKVLGPILESIGSTIPTNSRVCDLFAGSGTVSFALSREYEVTAIDIQRYSKILCDAVLNPTQSVADPAFLQTYSSVAARLSRAAEPLLAFETYALAEASRGNVQPMAEVMERGNLAVAASQGDSGTSEFAFAVATAIKRTARYSGSEAVCLRYYGGLFFSYTQAIQIDALLAAIRQRPTSHANYLAALLSAASVAVNTVGNQFAQPLRLRDKNGKLKTHLAAKVAHDRQLDVLSTYRHFLTRYSRLPPSPYTHRAIVGDFRSVLPKLTGEIDAVYADPPYTRDHHSRYYHVLETLVVGDEPVLTMSNLGGGKIVSRGIYRSERHQSDFCIKSRAPAAFDDLCGMVSQMRVPLVLSYSAFNSSAKARPRVVSIGDVRDIAAKHFPSVALQELHNSAHNKFNNATLSKATGGTAEVLLVCR
jgi:adenine-specific DNA-methyltransferase